MPLTADPERYWRSQARQLARLHRAHFREAGRRRLRTPLGRLLDWALARLVPRPAL